MPKKIEKEKSLFRNKLREFNEIFFSVVRSGGVDESKDSALLKRLDAIAEYFPLEEGYKVRPFEVSLGLLIFPSNERWNISIENIRNNYYKSLEKIFLKNSKEGDLKKEVPFLMHRASLRAMIADVQLKCRKRNNYCFIMPAVRVRKNENRIFGLNQQLYITHYSSTFAGDVVSIDEDYGNIFLDLTFYTPTHAGILNRRRAVEDYVFNVKNLKCSFDVIERLERKLKI
ncbi:MAG: hypothetical protein ACTSYD_10150 [Candidatus Heimdallarchaeaceae archaeon]